MAQVHPHNQTEGDINGFNHQQHLKVSEPQTQGSTGCVNWIKNHKCIFIGIIVGALIAVGLALGLGLGLGLKPVSPYKFHVHCPAYYYLRSLNSTQEISNLLTNNEAQLKKLYVISQTISTEEPTIKAQYCGFVRKWSGSCDDGFFECSNPGPAFDVVAFQEINVLWVNNISDITNDQIQPIKTLSRNQCYEPAANQLCSRSGKSASWRNKTYESPVNYGTTSDAYESFITSATNFPTSIHVHGLEVRPSYDGNPLSWFDNKGGYAVGYNSAQDPYINAFTDFKPSSLLSYYGLEGKPNKVNIYPNVQQPGSLWYHDHAMGTTSFNVRLGLHGFYLIRDPVAEADLPQGDYEKVLFLYEGSNIDQLITECSAVCTNTMIGETQEACYQCYIDHESSEESYMSQKPLYKNATYRFRLLNGDFNAGFSQIKFQVHGTDQTIPFQVIGTDSALKRTPVSANFVTLWSAERVDILINFNDVIFPPDSETVIISIVANIAQDNKPMAFLASYILSNDEQQNKIINITEINVPFVNLSGTDIDTLVSKKRMRTLLEIETPSHPDFGINGHIRYHQGASENPSIGTIQDWYFINFVPFTHPIHIHLIQFQILSSKSLKKYGQCLMYQIDFMLEHSTDACLANAGVNDRTLRDVATYDLICAFIVGRSSAQQQQCMNEFANQGTFDAAGISGIDVMSTCTAPADCSLYIDNACTFGAAQSQLATPIYYKYVCDDTSAQSIPDYTKGWKQVVPVPGSNVIQIRIRWTRTDFDQSLFSADCSTLENTQFFHIPEEDIIQFPGYIYHCHILVHEDKQMMRSIMMEPSRCYSGQTWSQKWQTINAAL